MPPKSIPQFMYICRIAVDEMQKKIDKLLAQLMKKAREKLELTNEVNRLRAANSEFCEKNCKKQLNAINCDLRFKENELSNLRKRVSFLAREKRFSIRNLYILGSTIMVRVCTLLQCEPQNLTIRPARRFPNSRMLLFSR